MSHAKMKLRLNILPILGTFIFQISFGQTTFEFKGKLTDCSDSLPLILGHVVLKQADSIIQTVPIDDKGQFKFKELKRGIFQLETFYFYYPATTKNITIPNDTEANICIATENPDSLLATYKSKQVYTIYYYGLPAYSNKDLNEVGKQYGVKWQNLGCVANDKFEKYNKMIEEILAYRNGKDWKGKFWNEVIKKHGE